MQPQPAPDQRKHPRRDASIVVSYCPRHPAAIYDITHTRNISQGGMMLTTATPFAPRDLLAIVARLAFSGLPQVVQGTAAAVESREIIPNLLYDTRVRFVDMARPSSQIIRDYCAGKADQFALTG